MELGRLESFPMDRVPSNRRLWLMRWTESSISERTVSSRNDQPVGVHAISGRIMLGFARRGRRSSDPQAIRARILRWKGQRGTPLA